MSTPLSPPARSPVGSPAPRVVASAGLFRVLREIPLPGTHGSDPAVMDAVDAALRQARHAVHARRGLTLDFEPRCLVAGIHHVVRRGHVELQGAGADRVLRVSLEISQLRALRVPVLLCLAAMFLEIGVLGRVPCLRASPCSSPRTSPPRRCRTTACSSMPPAPRRTDAVARAAR